jgi:hypothetical protein
MPDIGIGGCVDTEDVEIKVSAFLLLFYHISVKMLISIKKNGWITCEKSPKLLARALRFSGGISGLF